MKIVTAAEMREIDRRTTEEFGVPSLTLMENAGSAVAEFVLQQYPEAKRIGVICGKGNNGGDGFVAARKLHEAGKEVRVLLLADAAEVKGDAAEMLKRLPVKPVVARDEEGLKGEAAQGVFKNEDLLLDAIFGTGFKPPAQSFYQEAINWIWEGLCPVVSIDLPSGVDADSTVEPNGEEKESISYGVVTFTAPKPAHAFRDLTKGPIMVARIGSPGQALQSGLNLEVISRGADTLFVAAGRDWQAHKGSFGHVLVVGGSRGKAGAAAMAGIGALRGGAGLCTVATACGTQNLVSSFAAELMTEDLPETEQGTISLRAFDFGRMDEIARGKTVLAIGPGISRNPESAEFVRTLVHRRQVPVVLDADGLNAFQGHDEHLDGTGVPLVLTPHPGEMARLTGLSTDQVQSDRVGVARKFAQDHNCIVVLKGWRTLVAQPDGKVWVNMTGNPGMATGGTGDVLTGMIAGMLASFRNRDPAHVVAAAVRLHGVAGDLAAPTFAEMHSLTATDLLRMIPLAFNEARPRPGFDVIQEGWDRHRLKG